LELTPSALLTQNEIDAAKTVRFALLNVQDQPKLVWPSSFALARAYLDQLARDNGLPSERRAAVARSLSAAEKRSDRTGRRQLATLATALDSEAGTAGDPAKARMLADVVRKLSGM